MASEKFLQLFSTAAMLKVRNKHDMAFPFTDEINCLETSGHPTKKEIGNILKVVNDEDKLYSIYTEGVSHMKKHYSEPSVSNYVLNIISKHTKWKN